MPNIRKVICAISGGVDSAVSALLLKRQGFHVVGAFMRNWDVRDEYGRCMSDQDLEDAEYVCDHLGIPLHRVDFVKEYWNSVFSPMLQGYEEGFTPNPDVWCNRHIKFGAFFDYAIHTLGGDAVATGHYARNSAGQFLQHAKPGMGCQLLSGVDSNKDQTLFLCQIPQRALQRTMFPVGGLMKSAVRALALEDGMERIVQKKESMGICFIGSRNFQTFIDEYIEPKPGNFIDFDTGEVIGTHKGTHCWTLGQRAHISGRRHACFVAAMDTKTQNIVVAEGTDHPALFTLSLETEAPHWIDACPRELRQTGVLGCYFRFQHKHPLIRCYVQNEVGNSEHGSRLTVTLERPMRAVTPGQFAVFYDGDACLGSARILKSGPSMHELNHNERIKNEEQFS